MSVDRSVLPNNWFKRPADQVAHDLIGKVLCHSKNEVVNRLMINETEAYHGPSDSASHAFQNRRTNRTEVMFDQPGKIYMYLIYGQYWMLNIVTGELNNPSAVLIRGAGEFDGPGKLTRFLELDGSYNKKFLGQESGLWFEDMGNMVQVKATPRIGINYASEPWRSANLRFTIDR